MTQETLNILLLLLGIGTVLVMLLRLLTWVRWMIGLTWPKASAIVEELAEERPGNPETRLRVTVTVHPEQGPSCRGSFLHRASALDIAQRMKPGATITVRHHPTDPSRVAFYDKDSAVHREA